MKHDQHPCLFCTKQPSFCVCDKVEDFFSKASGVPQAHKRNIPGYTTLYTPLGSILRPLRGHHD